MFHLQHFCYTTTNALLKTPLPSAKLHVKNKSLRGELPWWLMVKNPPANEGDMGLIPDWGRSYMLCSN